MPASKLLFALEPFSKVYEEAGDLLTRHWEELTKRKDVFTVNPDLPTYRTLEEANRLAVVTARDEGKLVGYFVWFIFPHAHYQDTLVATEDLHFLHPEYRKGLNGYLLMREAVALLKPLNVTAYTIREKIGHEHPALMKRLGFTPMDVTYIKIEE